MFNTKLKKYITQFCYSHTKTDIRILFKKIKKKVKVVFRMNTSQERFHALEGFTTLQSFLKLSKLYFSTFEIELLLVKQ